MRTFAGLELPESAFCTSNKPLATPTEIPVPSNQRSELRNLFDLAWPVTMTQLAMMTMGIVDLWMVGRLGENPLASVALGDMWVWGTFAITLGLVVGLDPIVTQAHGAKDRQLLGLSLQRGLVFASFLAVLLTIAWNQAPAALELFGQEKKLLPDAGVYVDGQLASALPLLIFLVLRQYLQGRSLVIPAMMAVLWGNLFNVAANEVFIFGHLGFEPMGVYGAGLATGCSRFVLLFLLLIFMKRSHGLEDGWIPWNRRCLKLRGFLPLLRYGTPVALHYSSEVWAFLIAALMAGKLGASALAAHTIVIKIASLSFMVPLGISGAAATRVGNLLGKEDLDKARHSSSTAILLGGGVMTVSMIAFYLGRDVFPGYFIDSDGVIVLAAVALPIAAAFQVFDGLQVVATGVLRGAGHTLVPALVNLFGFYGIGLPCAYYLAFVRDQGLAGIWWGLCAGLGVVALALCGWVFKTRHNWRMGEALH